MKMIFTVIACLFTFATAQAKLGFGGEAFMHQIYLKGATASGSGSGSSYENAKPFVDSDLLAIEPNMVIEAAFVVIDEVVTGTSAFNIGDDDDADGYCATANVTLGTIGAYCPGGAVGGAYVLEGLQKYYPAAGKELKIDVTGTNTAGKARVIIFGHKLK